MNAVLLNVVPTVSDSRSSIGKLIVHSKMMTVPEGLIRAQRTSGCETVGGNPSL